MISVFPSLRDWFKITSGLVVFSSCISGCAAGDMVTVPEFAYVSMTNTGLENPVTVVVSLGGKPLDTLSPGRTLMQRVPFSSDTVLLSIAEMATGNRLLDSTFVLQSRNTFKILVDTSLGIQQFVSSSPDSTVPIPPGHQRAQIVNRLLINGVKKRITFKLFMDSTGLFNDGNIRELPQVFEDVGYGELSQIVDLPVVYYRRSPIAPRRRRQVYLQAVDAVSGEILVDIFEYGVLTGGDGEYWLVVPKIIVAEDGSVQWDYPGMWATLRMN